MKRWLLYIVILGLTIAAPAKPVNIGNLIPVRAIGVYQTGEQIRIETDTGNTGVGDTATQALCNLKESASGIIYLDKTEYLLLTEQTLNTAETLQDELNANAGVCMMQYPVDLAEVSRYLSVHGNLPKLKHWEKGVELPVLRCFEKNMNFFKKRT